MHILHVGCGRKQLDAAALLASVGLTGVDADAHVTHLDADGRLNPDVTCRLGVNHIPLAAESVDLVIAWHVLEHVGFQGDLTHWQFAWEELYRVLKPAGLLYGECPYYTSVWAWGDPTHTRAISEHAFAFFSQDNYRIEGSMISPYRIACDFQWLGMAGLDKGWIVLPDARDPKASSIRFALRARKPLRPWWEDVPCH